MASAWITSAAMPLPCAAAIVQGAFRPPSLSFRRPLPPSRHSLSAALLIGFPPLLPPDLSQKTKPKQMGVARALRSGGGGGRTRAADRVAAALPYFLPLLDGMQYGRFLFAQFPASERLFQPLFPLLRLYASIPYSNFVIFFTIYLALVRNPRFSRYVRFNAMQACVLDVLIVIPIIIQRILSPRSGFGLDLLILCYNFIFALLVAAVVFGVVSCILGKTPRLPIVAEAADNQLF